MRNGENVFKLQGQVNIVARNQVHADDDAIRKYLLEIYIQ